MRHEDSTRLLRALDRLAEISALPGHKRAVSISMIPGYPYVVDIEDSPQATGSTLTVACEKALAYFNPEPEPEQDPKPEVTKFAAPLPAGILDTPEVRKRMQSALEKETFDLPALEISRITDALCSNFPAGVQALAASDFADKPEVLTIIGQVALVNLDGDLLDVSQRRQVDIPVGQLIQALLASPRDSKVFLFGQLLAWSANNFDLITGGEYNLLKRSWR